MHNVDDVWCLYRIVVTIRASCSYLDAVALVSSRRVFFGLTTRGTDNEMFVIFSSNSSR